MNNKQIEGNLNRIEQYIKSTIEQEFPFTVKAFVNYDNQGNDFLGVFEASTGKYYSFLIEKEDGIPMLKPIQVKKSR